MVGKLVDVSVVKRLMSDAALRSSGLSVLDQMVVSLSNFLTGVIVARALLPQAFGEYSLYFNAVLLLGGIQNSLITGPISVLGVRTSDGDASGYFRAQVWLQLLLSTALIVGSGIGLTVAYPRNSFATFGFLLCLLLVQIQELARVINLTRMSLFELFRLDLITHASRVGLLLVALSMDVISSGTALFIIAIASGIGVVLAGRSSYPSAKTAPLRQTAHANWRYGRWLLLETIGYAASTQIYLYLTAIWINTAAVGGFTAVQIIMNALNVPLLGIINFAIPTARKLLIESGYAAWRQFLWRVGALLAVSAAIFGIAATVFSQRLIALVYSTDYANFAYLVPLVAIQLFLTTCNTVLRAAFLTTEMPQIGFAACTVSSISMILLAYPLLNGWGVTGTAIGLVITQALWTVVYTTCAARGTFDQIRAKYK